MPPSVLLSLIWVGLVHLFFLWVGARAGSLHGGEVWAATLLGERVLGRARLPTLLVAVTLLLLIYLWLDYRSRPSPPWRTAVFLLSAALLVYVGWAIWYAWWHRLELMVEPAEMIMTALAALAG